MAVISFFNSNIIYPIQRNLALWSIIWHSYYFYHKSYHKHDLEFLTSKRKYDHVSELWSLCHSLRTPEQRVLQCVEYRHTRIDGKDLSANPDQFIGHFTHSPANAKTTSSSVERMSSQSLTLLLAGSCAKIFFLHHLLQCLYARNKVVRQLCLV